MGQGYTLADNFVQGAFGGSFLNHQWLVCACTPQFPNAPDTMRVRLDGSGKLVKRPGSPSAKGIGWAWYAGGWNEAVADGIQSPEIARHVIYHRDPKSPNFQAHHQPFNYFARFAPGTADRARHLRDGGDFMADIAAGKLPAVSFYKPAGRDTQHPSYTDIMSGDTHIAGVLERLRASPQWKDMLVVVTYDENGGYWDHVPPPSGPGWGDRWGPGTRVLAIIIGPNVKRGHIDSTRYDTTSILKLITQRFGLEALPGVRANAGNLAAALQ